MAQMILTPRLMFWRVARSIHMRTTAIGCRKHTSNSNSFFIIPTVLCVAAVSRGRRPDDHRPARLDQPPSPGLMDAIPRLRGQAAACPLAIV
jgi:hypothetical protein